MASSTSSTLPSSSRVPDSMASNASSSPSTTSISPLSPSSSPVSASSASSIPNDLPPSPPAPYPFYLGGLAATFAVAFTHPLDMTKTRMQNASSKQGMMSTLIRTAKDEGVKGLYVGMSASLCRQMSYSLVRFGVYDALKAEALKSQPGDKKTLPAWKMGVCASAAGAVGGLAGNWADVLLVRMTSDVLKAPQERFNYPNAISGSITMIQSEGVTSLFRGLVPNLTRAVLMNVSQLATYDFFKSSLLSTNHFQEGTLLHFTASFLAGTVATTVCSPADVIKARIMAANGNGGGNIVQVLKKSIKNEGIQFLFRGWSPAWVRLSPNTILIFVTLEKMRVFVDWSREKRGATSHRSYKQWQETQQSK
ncbi:unnamed protein product [Sympodiomycopsis kandeliae]